MVGESLLPGLLSPSVEGELGGCWWLVRTTAVFLILRLGPQHSPGQGILDGAPSLHYSWGQRHIHSKRTLTSWQLGPRMILVFEIREESPQGPPSPVDRDLRVLHCGFLSFVLSAAC